jgi:hypothetical protein
MIAGEVGMIKKKIILISMHNQQNHLFLDKVKVKARVRVNTVEVKVVRLLLIMIIGGEDNFYDDIEK